MHYSFNDLDSLFYDDFDNPGMPTTWDNYNYSWPRVITWSTVDDQILFSGKYESVDDRIYQYIEQIEFSFSLWDEPLRSISFVRTNEGNDADITFGTSANTGTNAALFTRKIPPSTGYIEAGRVKINPDKFSNFSENLQTKIILHEIGNLLGLGDIKCTDEIISVQEDKCSPAEPFTGGYKLYDFDSQLIQYLYNESNSPTPEPTPVAPVPSPTPEPTPVAPVPSLTPEPSPVAPVPSPTPEPTPIAPIVLKGSRKRDRLKGTNGADIIFGKGGADKIMGRNGDDIIDPGKWTTGRFDKVKGGKGVDTFVIKDGYWAFIKDFKLIEDNLDLSGLSRGYEWEINGRRTYIYEDNGDEVARFKGKINLSKAEII